MLSCDEAVMICDKNQYGEASAWDKFRLRLHIITCKICRAYTKQNSLLTKVYKKKANEVKRADICMSAQDKDSLKRELEKMGA